MVTKAIRYEKKNIISVSEQGLRYLDEQGVETFMDFETCRKNWVIFVNSGEDLKGKTITENDTKCVGRRNGIEKPPYIEFFTDPPIRFEFSKGFFDWLFSNSKLRPDFQELQQTIVDAGWSTFDMS